MPEDKKPTSTNPLDLVLLTRERIQEVVDDAVRRGRMTHQDATDLATALLARGRRSTEDLFGEVEQLLGRSRETVKSATGIGESGFPIEGYDELTAAKVTAQLDGLSPAELRKVRDHEKRNANRKGVLAAVEKRLSA